MAPQGAPAVLVVDDSRNCVEANPEACQLVGATSDRVLGSPFDDLIAPAMRQRLDHVWQAFAGGGGHAGPFTLVRGDAEIQISITQNLMPGRHLLVITPITASIAPAAEFADRQRAPEAGPPSTTDRRSPTPRERQVLGLLAAGATDPQIAERLELSPATVQTHVRNAKSKLGARTRAQAVAMAIEQKLISL